MMSPFGFLLGTTAALVAGGAWESWLHRQRLSRIATRVHVNGTRGKSSVTRLIAAGLRAGGICTCAKTTGTLPRMILPDGSEYSVYRPARANVIEQRRMVHIAVDYEAEALVLECMALQPKLQCLSEERLVRATHAVITNARADHLDVMGPTEADVARALAGTVPVGGKLFTAEQRHLDTLAEAAADRGTELISIGPEDVARVTEFELARFPYVEHAENVALALRVCEDLGVGRVTALLGMCRAQPDPGAMTAHEMKYLGAHLFFLNGFAANDPESTNRVWHMAVDQYPHVEKRIAMFNCRADRPDRSKQLAESIVDWTPADHYVLIGSGTDVLKRYGIRRGLDPAKLITAEKQHVRAIFEAVIDLVPRSGLVMGLGNINGTGMEVASYFASRSNNNKLAASSQTTVTSLPGLDIRGLDAISLNRHL